MELRYLYVGSTDTGRDAAAWSALTDARIRWRFRHFGADVAAVDLGERPIVLVADHRPAGSVLPIYGVADLDEAVARLAGAGWSITASGLGTPEGPAAVLTDPSGTEIALLRVDRPGIMDDAYAAEDNPRRV